MNSLYDAIMRMDVLILSRVFMPFAHWVDYRFHKNQFDLAAIFLSAGMALNAAQTLQDILHDGWLIGAMMAMSTGILIWVYSWHMRKLSKASEAYERRPDIISLDAAFFMVIMPPGRMLLLLLGGLIVLMDIPLAMLSPTMIHLIRIVTSAWMLCVAISQYIAGGLPPRRDRKKKKEWAWPWMKLARA